MASSSWQMSTTQSDGSDIATPDSGSTCEPASSTTSRSDAGSDAALSSTTHSRVARKIAHATKGSQHPLSKLKNLETIGAVQGVRVQTQSSSPGNHNSATITCVVGDHETSPMLIISREAESIKRAKFLAANEVYEQVMTHFSSTGVPAVLTPPTPPPTPFIRPLTKAQIRQMNGDQEQLEMVKALANTIPDSSACSGVLSVDVEHLESNRSIILEVGVSFLLCSAAKRPSAIRSFHFIVDDHLGFHNGAYVADKRADFNFGPSVYVSGVFLAYVLVQLINSLAYGLSRVVLVGHSVQGDVDILRQVGLDFDQMERLDIGRAYRAWCSRGQYLNMIGMEQILQDLSIVHENLHNGGNDAHYNIKVLQALMCRLRQE